MRVRFCGVRGSTPAPGAEFTGIGGHTSCLAVSADGVGAPTLLLDAGTGLRTVTALLGGQPLQSVIPILAVAVECIVFTLISLWRFNQEEL